MPSIIDYEAFLKLPADEIAKLVHDVGPQVCVFTINGTRRWFTLECEMDVKEDSFQSYMEVTGKRYLELYQLCFEHGIDTILVPVFRSELLLRSNEYVQRVGAEGLAWLAREADHLSFYQQQDVSVHFYGDYRKKFPGTPFEYLTELFDDVTQQTSQNKTYKLFYGVFANSSTETIAELAVRHFQKTGNLPTQEQLIEQYYGVYIPPVTLYIGFDKPRAFDYPLLDTKDEDLYFTTSPSPYLNQHQLRTILYDHLYARQVDEIDYSNMSKQDYEYMKNFYRNHHQSTLGVGEIRGGVWYPKSDTIKE